MTNFINYIRLLRPAQWIKNIFVLLAVFFGGKMLYSECWLPLLESFAIFCAASSAVYCLNDVIDSKADAANPAKRQRPVAAGKVSKAGALTLSALLAAGSIAAAFALGTEPGFIISAYLALNLLYCFGLKRVPLLDVAIIALGFELRLMMGSAAGSVVLSSWIVIMVFLLTYFLGMAKRRSELLREREHRRQSVRGYTKEYIDLVLTLLAAIMIVAYIIYTVQPTTVAQFGTDKLYVSALFVLGAMLRYMQIAVVNQATGSPTKVFYRDKIIIANVVCWLLCFVIAIYL